MIYLPFLQMGGKIIKVSESNNRDGNTWMVILQYLKPEDILQSRGLANSYQKR